MSGGISKRTSDRTKDGRKFGKHLRTVYGNGVMVPVHTSSSFMTQILELDSWVNGLYPDCSLSIGQVLICLGLPTPVALICAQTSQRFGPANDICLLQIFIKGST